MARFGSVAVINKVGLIIMKPFYCIDVGCRCNQGGTTGCFVAMQGHLHVVVGHEGMAFDDREYVGLANGAGGHVAYPRNWNVAWTKKRGGAA